MADKRGKEARIQTALQQGLSMPADSEQAKVHNAMNRILSSFVAETEIQQLETGSPVIIQGKDNKSYRISIDENTLSIAFVHKEPIPMTVIKIGFNDTKE